MKRDSVTYGEANHEGHEEHEGRGHTQNASYSSCSSWWNFLSAPQASLCSRGLLVSLIYVIALEARSESFPLPANTPLTNVTFVAFDTETTGLKAESGHLVEIAAVKFRLDRVLERQSWLINPGVPIPEAARRVNHITDALVSNSPPVATVLPQFVHFAQGTVLLAHNARFDRGFVAAEAERHALALPTGPLFDSLPLFRAWFPGPRRYNLESLTTSLLPALTNLPPSTAVGERTNQFHTALWDSECLAALFVRGATNLPPQATLADLLRVSRGAYSFQSPKRLWRPAVARGEQP